MLRPISMTIVAVGCSTTAVAEVLSLDSPSIVPTPSGAYLCLESASGGVQFNESLKRWEGRSFKAQDKFVVRIDYIRSRTRPPGPFDSEKGPIVVGADYRVMMSPPAPQLETAQSACTPTGVGLTDPVPVHYNGELSCRMLLFDLRFNLSTGRFILVYRSGFISGRDVGGDTPSVSVGTCTRISG